MTHPIIEGLTEAVTMAKLMRENEELRGQLAEERALADRLYGVAQVHQPYGHTALKAYRKARGL